MPYGLYISAEGAHAQTRRLEVLANNLANADTAGFKRDLAICRSRAAEATQRGLDQIGSHSLNDLGGGVWVQETKTDFSQGPLKVTGKDLDLAINGPGFFAIQRDNKTMLTRAGNFNLDPNGRLVTENGDSVLSDSGTPIVIDPTAGPYQITPDGGVQQAGSVTNLAIVAPHSFGDLAKIGDSLFQPLSPPVAVTPGDRRVKSGVLEGSGVRPTLEMMELIETSRAFEANANMIKHQDTMMGTLISRVLKDN